MFISNFFYVKDVVENIDIDAIAGIGFDATCSLVALDNNDSPITVSPTGNWNIGFCQN